MGLVMGQMLELHAQHRGGLSQLVEARFLAEGQIQDLLDRRLEVLLFQLL